MHWKRKWQPTPVLLPGESQGRGSLMGCHLWGRTESDTTEVTWQHIVPGSMVSDLRVRVTMALRLMQNASDGAGSRILWLGRNGVLQIQHSTDDSLHIFLGSSHCWLCKHSGHQVQGLHSRLPGVG